MVGERCPRREGICTQRGNWGGLTAHFRRLFWRGGVESEGEIPTAQAVLATVTLNGARAGHALVRPILCALLAQCSFFRKYPLLLVAHARLKKTWLR
jgi:hypothetical protein